MARAVAIREFDLWRPGYGGATVSVVRAGSLESIPLFANDDGTVRIENPQSLLSLDRDGILYGRFRQPVYVIEDYSLLISTGGGEAIARVPLTTLEGEDIGQAIVKAESSTFEREVADRVNYEINVLDYGDLSHSSAENSDLIDRAIGVAAAAGGGVVRLPRAEFDIQALTPIPSNVRLVGHGIGATVMRAAVAADIITLTGVRSGIEGLELDGLTLPGNSVGVRLAARVQAGVPPPAFEGGHMRDVLVRRFERGVQATHGGAGFVMRGCVVTENNIGIELDAIDGPIEDMVLSETRVDLNSSKGIVLHSSQFHRVSDIQIRKCSLRRGPDLLDIEGARNTICTATTFRGGARPGVQGSENLSVRDVPEDATVTTDGLYFHACSFQNMRQRFEGACENLRYNNCRFDTNFWDLNSPRNSILLLDADESPDDRVESSGTANLVRKNDGLTHIDVPDRTTDATAKAVWSYRLAAGECAYLEVTATGRQLNGTNVAVYRTERGVYLAGATLAFDNGITEFRVGDLVANKTRTGRARITAKTGTAATGTLTISEIQGEFLNDDVIGTPDLNGAIPESATVNGALSYPAACTLFDTDAETAKETDNSWGGLGLVANGQSVDVVVGGKAATTIDWTVNLKLTRI